MSADAEMLSIVQMVSLGFSRLGKRDDPVARDRLLLAKVYPAGQSRQGALLTSAFQLLSREQLACLASGAWAITGEQLVQLP
jgi:hypothetical protein